jgi:steroid delta-isomerase-like uncharacterized protein
MTAQAASVSAEVTMAEVRTASVDDQKRAIEDWAAYWSAHDMARLLSLFTDDVVYEDVTKGVVNRGAAELWAFGEGFFSSFPDVTVELRSSFADGTKGGAEWIMRGTQTGNLPGMPATGKRVELRGASIFEFVGDKIRRCSDYWDMATLLKQLGLMPSA